MVRCDCYKPASFLGPDSRIRALAIIVVGRAVRTLPVPSQMIASVAKTATVVSIHFIQLQPEIVFGKTNPPFGGTFGPSIPPFVLNQTEYGRGGNRTDMFVLVGTANRRHAQRA